MILFIIVALIVAVNFATISVLIISCFQVEKLINVWKHTLNIENFSAKDIKKRFLELYSKGDIK